MIRTQNVMQRAKAQSGEDPESCLRLGSYQNMDNPFLGMNFAGTGVTGISINKSDKGELFRKGRAQSHRPKAYKTRPW